MNDSTFELFITLIILNVLFPFFALAFTDPLQGVEALEYDIALDPLAIINAGIHFEDADSVNITFKGAPIDFNVSGKRLRVAWVQGVGASPDRFRFAHPSLIEVGIGDLTGDYYSLGGSEYIVYYVNDQLTSNILNATVINGWDYSYNWTRVDVAQRGQSVFFTPITPDYPNITKGVMETGSVTLTVGKIVDDSGNMNFFEFIEWYWTILRNPNYGLPSFFAWVMRLLLTINMVMGIIVARDILLP